MVILVAHNVDNGYTTSIKTAYNSSINLKFDSGASFTTIPYELLKDMVLDDKKYMFSYYHQMITFKTASKTDVLGALCSIDDVKIGAIKFPTLYFYMTFNTGRDVGLLGCEIIDNLKFTHDISGNIIATEFDNKKYDDKINRLFRNISGSSSLSLEDCYEQYVRERAQI